jgi:hypothetical protein
VVVELGIGEHRFHPKAANGEVIASSEGYTSKAGAENGIKSVQTNAPGATVGDHTGYFRHHLCGGMCG